MVDFDFGFTAVDEDELESVTYSNVAAVDAANRLEQLYNAIIPLLENLKKNPEKDYILWPDRLAKIEAFQLTLAKIVSEK